MRKVDIYDKKSIYEEQMEPLVHEILQIAKENSIPVIVSAAVSNNEKATTYESNVVLAVTELSLFENRIANILFLMNDFYAEAPAEIRHMADELIHYLKPSVPDLEDRLDVRLTDDKISEIYNASLRTMELHFPEGIFPSVIDDE